MSDRNTRLLSFIRAIRESDGVTSEQLEELLPAPGAVVSENAVGLPITEEALDAWHRFEEGQTLSATDRDVLESVILGNALRPAYDIQNDTYAKLPSLWQALNDQRGVIEPLLRGVGRVDLDGHDGVAYAGTAFVCGDRLLLTNRHVAEYFASGVGAYPQLSFKPGISALLDLKQEVGSPASVILKVVAPVLVSSEWDAAILRVDTLPTGCAALPLARQAPANLENRMMAAVGYPAFNPSEDLVQQIKIFRGTFDKKRLLPGRTKGIQATASYGRMVEALAHDCSTLTGNSGSALIDVDSGNVIGVHFKGVPLKANFAVPTWALAEDQRVLDLGVSFSN